MLLLSLIPSGSLVAQSLHGAVAESLASNTICFVLPIVSFSWEGILPFRRQTPVQASNK
jgi:hypothetical protein